MMKLITFYLSSIILMQCVFLLFDKLFQIFQPLMLLGCLVGQDDAIRYIHAHEVKSNAVNYGLIPYDLIISSSCFGFI